MKNVELVENDLYLIKQPLRVGWFCGVIVVLGTDQIGLVDTGFENTPVDYIFPFIHDLGRRPEEITYVVNTHRDGDHVLGNSVIKAKTNARIGIHELEAEAVKAIDFELKEGDIVELGDRRFTIMHTPGHRPGSICLYDSENKLLITGDSICGDRSDLIRMDKTIYTQSLKKLLNLDIQVLIMSHPFQPLGKSVLRGDEIKDMISASIQIAKNLK